jgi:hypothetical protein
MALTGHDQLVSAARTALGAGHRVVEVNRLRGGTKKGVYRLTFADDSTVIVYSWAPEENYWPTARRTDPFADASGIDLFESAHQCLRDVGVRTPEVYLVDRTADIAVVEDVPGGTLEDLLRRDPSAAESAMVRLADWLALMRQHRSERWGKVAHVEPQDRSCAEVLLDRALGDIDEAAARDARIAGVRDRLVDVVHELAGRVRPRAEYVVVHGELGPDHVLVDRLGSPVLIDIEGLLWCDVEWEHVFLRLRFGEHYRWLAADGLDDARLAFYSLAMHLSLVAGPLRLLDGDFPEREGMAAIAEVNLLRVLDQVR